MVCVDYLTLLKGQPPGLQLPEPELDMRHATYQNF